MTTTVNIPPLMASGGDLAVVYRTAAYTWGAWSATYPEGVTPPVMEPGRELGYVGQLQDGAKDLGSRCWTRTDVQVDGVEHFSTVPSAFDAAEVRTAGEVFFEQDLDASGLGNLTPLIDFNVGDVVPVLAAGKVIDLPVTAVDMTSAVGDELGWRVHVGGQLVSDRAELDSVNAALERQILRESRETNGRLDEVRQAASEAKSAASAADSKADAALSEVRDKAGELGKLLDRAEAAVADGRAHDAEATRLLEQSRSQLNTAVARLDQVEKLLDASDAKLAENKALAEIIKEIRAGVEKTGKEIDAQLAQARLLNDEAKTASAEAASHGAAAKEALAGTRELHGQVAILLEDTARYVKESRESLAESRRLSEAAERSKVDAVAGAEKARVMAEQAEATLTKVAGKSAEVDKALVEVRELKAKAGQAVTDAGGVLDQAKAAARATGADKDAVSTLYRQVVDKHQSILSLHGEMLAVQADINAKQQTILEAHEQAIKVTARAVKALAGSQAAMAGTLAYLQESLEAAQRAIDAANSAIESNREAIRRLAEIQRMHEKAIRELSVMTTELQKAQVKLAETNATILTTQANLKKTDEQLKHSDALIQKQVDNNTLAQETTNRAVRALGGSVGAMAGSLAYMQESQENTQKTARDALDAAAANTEVLRIQKDVNAKALAVAKDAESVATGTRAIALATKYASQVNSVAIENSKRRQDFIDKILLWTADTLRMQRPVEWMQGGGGSNASADYEKYFTLNTSYGANSVYVNLQGAWDGHLKITLYMRSGLTDFAQWSIAGGRTESVYAGHDKKRIAGITGGAGQEVRGVEIIATPITLPDGTKPQLPSDPSLLPVPPVPLELQNK